MDLLLRGYFGERLDNDPSGARYGCFLPDLTGLARCLPAPTSQSSNTGWLVRMQGSCRRPFAQSSGATQVTVRLLSEEAGALVA